MIKQRLFVVASIAIVLSAITVTSFGQRPNALRPTVFAIKDARVVTEPGKVMPKATVVIRDGLIENVGEAVKTPADALLIEGKGLTVYPGFTDALSHWGFD